MFVHNINPILLTLGPLELRWYGLAYLFGFFFCIWWLQYWRKKGELKLTSDEVWDFGFYLMLGALIGARLFLVFWEPTLYLKDPLEFFRVWNGGMSFHGGLVGVIIAGAIYVKKKELNFLELADLLAVPAIFGLAVGRVANFINAELYGPITNVSWCVDFSQNQYITNLPDGCRHPTPLYAAAKRFAVFGWLYFLSFSSLRKQFKPGFIFWNFMFWDGLGRLILDIWRIDPVRTVTLTPGQWFSITMMAVALYFFWKNHQEDWKALLRLKKTN